MNLEIRKYQIIEKVMGLSDVQLQKIEFILKEENLLDAALDRALAQVKEGKVKSHEEVKKIQ